MIYLSHNSKDKVVVEPIALKLREILGEDKVFYDSWSIQPGEGIIDRMNEGLSACKVFFFFLSRNSLESFMVKLEWQNAVYAMTQGKVKFVPVRLDDCSLPPIIAQNKYIDIYENGYDRALLKIIEASKGENVFNPDFKDVKNITARLNPSYGEHIEVSLEAKHHIVPATRFVFLSQAKQSDISYDSRDILYRKIGYMENFTKINDECMLNAFMIDFCKPLVPGFPLYADFNSLIGHPFSIVFVYHEIKLGTWERVEIN
jgi:hypothetical protein